MIFHFKLGLAAWSSAVHSCFIVQFTGLYGLLSHSPSYTYTPLDWPIPAYSPSPGRPCLPSGDTAGQFTSARSGGSKRSFPHSLCTSEVIDRGALTNPRPLNSTSFFPPFPPPHSALYLDHDTQRLPQICCFPPFSSPPSPPSPRSPTRLPSPASVPARRAEYT